MNLVKELHRTASKNYKDQLKEANDSLESVKANLQMQDTNDHQMLQFFGTKQVVSEQKTKVREVETLIANEFLTKDDIRSVCLRYHLRFLPAHLYKKEIPLQALNDLRKFRDKHKVNDWTMRQNLSIIAPGDHFALGPRPAKDPVLIYRVDSGNYQIISTWGNDFNFTRRIAGFINTYPGFSTLIVLAVFLNSIVTYFVIERNAAPEIYFTNLLICFIVGIISAEMSDSTEIWDQPYE